MDGFHLFDPSVGLGTQVLLVVALLIALSFEFVNGFHDTANAVATVIYTRSLGPRKAVVWSGLCNFAGVVFGGTLVAFGIISLLPTELLVNIDSARGLAMVLALLLAAIAWNLGTWLMAIPASSSHTLIGAILGVGLANSALPGHKFGAGVNWGKAGEIGLSLLISPFIGFACAALLLLTLKRLVTVPELYQPPDGDKPPPFWIRGTLLLTCTGVSLAHGSNDGQKGIGLVMLILIGVLPAHYALDPRPDHLNEAIVKQVAVLDPRGETPPGVVHRVGLAVDTAEGFIRERSPQGADQEVKLGEISGLRETLKNLASFRDVPAAERWEIRAALIRVDEGLLKIQKTQRKTLSATDSARLEAARELLREPVFYAPVWVLGAVATALGLGTMIGWKRIVTTVGEKIGKDHLTYAQGASAELVAMATIGLADYSGLPVSTTHVLSSGVAGTMAANRSGLQASTVRNIALAWVLTLPVCMTLSASLFLLFRFFVG